MAKTKKILAIDDEIGLLDEVKACLESSGYDVLTARNGLEGLQSVKENNPDLVLLDISMPQMDGLEVLAEMRRTKESATTPVVMLSGKGKSDNIFEAEKLRAVDFLIKPFRADELLDVVRKSARY